jgi:DNA-binding NarL/FixJ family response regulator
VIVMDIRMPEMDGLAATAELVVEQDTDVYPAGARPKELVLTTFDLDEHVYDALAAGASGFLLKDATAERLFDAVRVVAAGDALLAPSITRRLIGDFARRRRHQRPSPQATAGLTPRELDVLRLMARGLSNAEIAAELVLAEQTIKTHVGHVLTKLALRDRTQAVVYAYENGLVG